MRNNGVLFDRVSIDISRSVMGDTFSVRDQGFISAIVVGVIIMFGLFSSVGVILAGCIGLAVLYFIGFLSMLTMAGVISAIVVGVLLSLMVRR